MKTYYFNSRPKFLYSVMGLLGLFLSSCGSYQNTSYNDNDGIYENGQTRRSEVAQNTSSNGYTEYFGSLQDNNDVEIFTDVDNYRTADDSTQTTENRGYESGYSGWGSAADNVTVNVYGGNNWGYSPWNYWYGPSWGWGWNTGWGYSGWYGPGLSIGWGWNNWYGPGYGYGWGWNNYYGNNWYGHNHNHYSYNNGIRGTRNEMYGQQRNSVGRRYSSPATRNTNFNSSRRTSVTNGTRSTQYNTSRGAVRNNPATRSRTYTPSTNTRSSNRSYTPSSNNSSRSYSPSSSGGGRSSGGGSYGGGGRSGGGGSRR